MASEPWVGAEEGGGFLVSAHAPDCPSHVPQSGSLKSHHGARETGWEGKEWCQGDGNYGMAKKGRWKLFSDDFATLIRNVARNVARREPSVWVSACGPAPPSSGTSSRAGAAVSPQGPVAHALGAADPQFWGPIRMLGGDTAGWRARPLELVTRRLYI